MTRVLITRPEPGASRTLSALHTRGIKADVISLTEIIPLAFQPPHTDFDALVITSQNAILHGRSLLLQHIAKPVFAVGQRTAKTLGDLGHHINHWAPTALGLLPLIIEHKPKAVIYICGQTRRLELETGLAAAAISVEIEKVYNAAPTQLAAEKLADFLSAPSKSIVLLHAPSAAKAFSLAMNGQNLPISTRFLCMSAAVSAQLPEKWHGNVTHSVQPDDTAMINQLDKMLAQDHL